MIERDDLQIQKGIISKELDPAAIEEARKYVDEFIQALKPLKREGVTWGATFNQLKMSLYNTVHRDSIKIEGLKLEDWDYNPELFETTFLEEAWKKTHEGVNPFSPLVSLLKMGAARIYFCPYNSSGEVVEDGERLEVDFPIKQNGRAALRCIMFPIQKDQRTEEKIHDWPPLIFQAA